MLTTSLTDRAVRFGRRLLDAVIPTAEAHCDTAGGWLNARFWAHPERWEP